MILQMSTSSSYAAQRFQVARAIKQVAQQIKPARGFMAWVILFFAVWVPAMSYAAPLKLVAFGDSLTAGYGLPPDASFAMQMEKALKSKGLDVVVIQGGVSGDTTAMGLVRLDWTVPDDAKGVILELGANDSLRGQSPQEAKQNLDAIITRLKSRGIAVYLAGMLAFPNMGVDYAREFNAIYPLLSDKHKIPLYPFFLEGVATDPKLNLPDGLHPTREGIAVIVARMLPGVEKWAKGLN